MKQFKRLLALTMGTVVALTTLAGCSKPSNTAETTKETKEEAKTEINSTETAPGEKTVITVWTKDRHDAEFQQAKVDAYNKTNTDNIEVVYEIYSDNYVQAVDMVFQNGDAPDMFVFQEQMFTNYVNSGKYADITPFMDEEFKKTFGSALVNGMNVIDGKTYYVPTAATTCRLFYNKEIFDRVGLTKAPETLEEMVDAAKLITSKLSGEGIYGFAANMKSPTSALNRSLAYMTERELGRRLGYDFAAGQYNFMDYTDILKAWKELLSPAAAFPGCESLDIDPLRTQFAAGKIGMYISFTHAEPGVYENQFPMEQEWACAPIPTSGGKVVGKQNYTPLNGYLFNAESENLEAAWKVYKAIFANVDNLVEYYEAGLGISSIPAVIEKAKPADIYINNPTLLVGDGDAIWPKTPHEKNTDAVIVEGQVMYDVFGEMLLGDKDIESGLQDLTARYNAALKAGIDEGIGKEIKIDHFDPMNPSKS
ncbi:ABC transporter substrate-binding protein [Cellulosilyticum sp. I15G10I2]|uniref:ABC transporter substrate-binding protein n=1 Tax=Cellulosilyticum sp. I15G10I2 TaxID=1892843 RepID=UPI00085BDD54|nr:extracellular solute-binding protein [Cellulosilyticum sp. I15G10I2]